jgi:hypothetical protein
MSSTIERVESSTESRLDGPSPIHEHLDRCVMVETAQREEELARYAQCFPAGGDHAQAVDLAQQPLGHHRGLGDEVLTVVEHDDHVPARQAADHEVEDRWAGGVDAADLQRRGQHRCNPCGVAEACELDEPGAVGSGVLQGIGDFHREPGLADAARPDQRDQAVRRDRRDDLCELRVAPDETGEPLAEVARPDRPDRPPRTRQVEPRVLRQHLRFEVPQTGSGFESELLDEDLARVAVHT